MPGSLLAQFNMPLMPEQASEFAKPYDSIFFATTALTVFFIVVVVIMITVFVIRYRHGVKADRSNAPTSHMLLEITWTAVPFILAMGMFFWSSYLFVQQRIPPKDAQEIYVIGKQWMWHIQHPNGIRENNELHVPVGKDIKLVMIAQDVIHSFYIPAFRMKQDVVPGRYTMQWFKATKPGKYPIFCAEYCGTQHSEMGGYVYVMSQADFDKWQANGGEKVKETDLTPVAQGKALFERYRCATCHVDADTERGPTLFGLVGKTRDFTDGSKKVADREYVRESIVSPEKHLVKGYDNTMATYKDDITEDQLLYLYEYIRTLGGPSRKPASAPAATNQTGTTR
ncbi:MAG: cytochrome c oxidase subunit II [Armatimonadetes bacterium]|nr:cytochrome c oxidase subunit II [Armatimonadota bacterium]